MEIKSELIDGVLVANVNDRRLAADTAVQFKAGMQDVMKQSPSSTVVLDLSNVRFVDSTGVGAVVSVLKIMGGSKQLVLAGLNETVQQLFKLTRMDKVFPIFPDVQHALNSRNATSAPGSA